MPRFISASFTLVVLVAPCFVVADMFRPSIKDQIQLGKKAAVQIRTEEKILPDSDPRVLMIRRLGKSLTDLIPQTEKDKKPFEYTFDIVESNEINAFALPGGPIFFYSGLLANLETEDQVMGVLAHELIHVRKEHWASAYEANQKRQLGLTLALILLKANRTVFDIAGVSDALLFTLPYSRKHETESDTLGFGIMVQAGFNPQGMVEVFKVLQEKGGSQRTAEWLSSHPDSSTRIKNIEKRIATENKTYPEQKPVSEPIKSRNLMSSRRKIPTLL